MDDLQVYWDELCFLQHFSWDQWARNRSIVLCSLLMDAWEII